MVIGGFEATHCTGCWTSCFREDDQRASGRGTARGESGRLRKLALCLLKAEKSRSSKGKSINTRRLIAGWKNDYLLTVLAQIPEKFGGCTPWPPLYPSFPPPPPLHAPPPHPVWRPILSRASGLSWSLRALRRLGFPVLRWISVYRHAVVITPMARWVLIARGTASSNRYPLRFTGVVAGAVLRLVRNLVAWRRSLDTPGWFSNAQHRTPNVRAVKRLVPRLRGAGDRFG